MGSLNEQYDFIVVGSGPAGSAVAARLAKSPKQPKVLLIEAGTENADNSLRIDGERWITFMNPELNWGYKTTPQKDAHDRVVDYSRGRGLGGSSAMNFGVFAAGARDDYEEWARIAGDDSFKWENVQKRLKSLESFHADLPEAYQKYVGAKKSDHGSEGRLNVGYATEWEKDVVPVLDAFEEAGWPMNPDHNSGNPIGMAACINSSYRGRRTTAADLLKGHPSNLTILTNTIVDRLIVQDKRVVGVEAAGNHFMASKEVVISAGSIDSPKILMLSGIGPADELAKHDISLIQDLPVGKNLRDHTCVVTVYIKKEGTNDRAAFYGSEEAMATAREEWLQKDGSGPWSVFGCQGGIGYFKAPRLYETDEFKTLPKHEQEYLTKETVPSYEVFTHFPVHMLNPDMPNNLTYQSLAAFPMNEQSRGEVTLQSKDPRDPPIMDPKLLSHPFDQRVAIESLRDVMEFSAHPAYARDTLAAIHVPKSNSDEDLLEFIRENAISVWHMTGTVKMGKAGEKDACVDSDFKVVGIENLRVADMSVVPVLTNNHTQATAYIAGASLADKLVAEYGL